MFNSNEKISRILGNGQGQGVGLPRQGLGFGRGIGPGAGFQKTNVNINPREVIAEIQILLDKLPQVKKADGKISIDFIDGTKGNFVIKYN